MGASSSSRSAGEEADATPLPLAPQPFRPVDRAPEGEEWREDSRDFRLWVEIPDVLDAEQCDLVLGYIDRFGHMQGRVIREDDAAVRLDSEVRRVRQTSLPRTPETTWVYKRLASAIDGCNQECFGFDLRDFSSELAIVDYREGDFYDWHLDLGRGVTTRKLSVSVVLSTPEDYTGGGLTFPGAEFDRVARGNAVVFPSFLLHGVQPVTQGRRCALLGWIGGPSFR